MFPEVSSLEPAGNYKDKGEHNSVYKENNQSVDLLDTTDGL